MVSTRRRKGQILAYKELTMSEVSVVVATLNSRTLLEMTIPFWLGHSVPKIVVVDVD